MSLKKMTDKLFDAFSIEAFLMIVTGGVSPSAHFTPGFWSKFHFNETRSNFRNK